MKILFVLKRREDYNQELHSKTGLQTGLWNSANFVNEMLKKNGINSKMVVVTDNNDIDYEVTAFQPDYVIIEALWVVPSKFAVLTKLHPKVKWIIRLHSDMPFMAQEGIAMDWIADYADFPNVYLGINSSQMLEDVTLYLNLRNNQGFAKTIYLPNYYPPTYKKPKAIDRQKEWLDIGCFGAIRPLKNHLTQAFAALGFAESIHKKLRFHINIDRYEMNGQPVYNNLKGLFQQLDHQKYQLILHGWAPHDEFLKTVSEMDIGMQVSFSETFNIVGADFVAEGIPFMGSSEIPWLKKWFSYNTTDSVKISIMLKSIYEYAVDNVEENQRHLTEYSNTTEAVWLAFLNQ